MCYLYFFCLHCCLINIHIFDYPDSQLSELFTEVPTSPDNRGSTVLTAAKQITDLKFAETDIAVLNKMSNEITRSLLLNFFLFTLVS